MPVFLPEQSASSSGYKMIILLILILLIMLFLSMLLFKGDIFHPACMSILEFLVVSIVCMFALDGWGVSIDGSVVIVVVLLLFSFVGGSLLANQSRLLIREGDRPKSQDAKLSLRTRHIILMIFICGVALAVTFQQSLALALSAGYMDDMYMGSFVSTALEESGLPLYVVLLQSISQGIAYVSFYLFAKNFMLKKRINFLYLIPSILYFITASFNTSRSTLFACVVYALYCIVISYYFATGKDGMDIKKGMKVLCIGLLALVIFVMAFVALGNYTGKTQAYGFMNTIMIYFGSSIANLSEYLQSLSLSDFILPSDTPGKETLFGLTYTLSRLGFPTETGVHFLDFIQYANGDSSNVYTSFRRYIEDYGFLFAVLIQFWIGYIYTYFYQRAKHSGSDALVISYAFLSFYLLYQCFEEQILYSFLSVSQLLSVASIGIVYFIVKKIATSHGVEKAHES